MKKNILFLFCMLPLLIKAQNNPIFFGGLGNGNQTNTYSQLSNSEMYNGGNDDGAAVTTYTQQSNNVIFTGGNNDGAVTNGYIQTSNENIFNGGNSEGSAALSYQQLETYTIFKGGQGDGWANTIMPLGPLPIDLLSFAAQKQNDAHLLQWEVQSNKPIQHFEIEWSANAKDFEYLGTVKYETSKSNYNFISNAFNNGSNFYRIKIVEVDNSISYSNIVELFEMQDANITIYPNPTVSDLNIQINSSTQASTIQIMNTNGQVLLTQSIQSNKLENIDVRNLSSGTYILSIKTGARVQFNQFIKL